MERGFIIRQVRGWTMSAKRSKVPVPSSVWRISRARKMLREMSDLERIEVAVKVGVMTRQQADKAKRRLAEIEVERSRSTLDAPAR